MVISQSELNIIINGVGYTALHISRIVSFASECSNNRATQDQRDAAEVSLKAEIRSLKRLVNTVISRNSIQDEVRSFNDADLQNMRIKLD